MKKAIKKDPRFKLLAQHLDIGIDEAGDLIESGDWLVLTDNEADEKCRESILDSVWAFNASFMSAYLKRGVLIDAVTAIQKNGKCEENNEALLCLLDDKEYFIEEAIKADGRGHFLAGYDGEEVEIGKFYGYRTN
jgi:hypothetical protein